MNYPIWDVPASGLFIAVIAVIHVFISHFAVGGGLFLVLTEQRARREGDGELLAYLKRHSRFFILVTLVAGALTGVGIWFTIGLVHPAATSSLIQLFVWFWAIEWTFFVTEIAAALVYYYGWDRLSPGSHVTVGWIYFGSAWMSLVVINGILTFMLTPGDWVLTGNVWAAFFNPTYWPALVARSLASAGLAGLYALLTASWMAQGDLKRRLARYASAWVLPMAIALPLSLLWYLWAAAAAGVDVSAVFGLAQPTVASVTEWLVNGSASGYPIARLAALACLGGGVILTVIVLGGILARPASFGPLTVVPVLLAGLITFGGAEFVREDLRKPYVIGQFMFVNGVRLPVHWAISTGHGRAGAINEDAFTVDRLGANGLLATAKCVRAITDGLPAGDLVAHQEARGRAAFVLLCASCHTMDGHLAIRPLVKGRPVGALDTMLGKLASPVGPAGDPATWSTPRVRLVTWRGRHMPPFAGTASERRDLAVFLALLGGASREQLAEATAGDAGARAFDEDCAMCHGPDGQWPMAQKARRTADEFYELLGRLPEVNEMMPPFTGEDGLRRALASHLATITGGGAGEALFEENCSMCHGAEGEWPIAKKPQRTPDEFYELLGRLPAVNELMQPFAGTDAQRRALASHLSTLARGQADKGIE
jgi:mono/diheme cytochrome c family protein